jgi:hypothetical protein
MLPLFKKINLTIAVVSTLLRPHRIRRHHWLDFGMRFAAALCAFLARSRLDGGVEHHFLRTTHEIEAAVLHEGRAQRLVRAILANWQRKVLNLGGGLVMELKIEK